MNEELFNADLRRFLKTFGVTAQREIEKAVWQGLQSGALENTPAIKARAKLEVEGVELDLVVEETIHIS
jgi:hypothetical protein